MISYISGKIIGSNKGKNPFIDILLSSGIGYRVFVTSKYVFPENNSVVSLHTSFQVREDSQSLYGFERAEERNFFEQLLTITGIGPKVGISILSTYDIEEVKKFVLDGDSSMLSKVPGLGIKGAQKIILELRGKIDFDREDGKRELSMKERDLKDALRALGYMGRSLDDALKKGRDVLDKNGDIEIEQLIREVLTSND